MSSIHFDPMQILRGDVEQIRALFAAVAGIQASAGEAGRSDDINQILALVLDPLDPKQPIAKQLTLVTQPKGLNLTPGLQLRITVAEKLMHSLFDGNQLAPELQAVTTQLTVPFVRMAVQDDSIYCQTEHPARELFNELIYRGYTWYPKDSKPSQLLFEKLQELIKAAISCWSSKGNPDDLTKALATFRRWVDTEDKRAQLLETRLCETELASLKLSTAECEVIDLINNALADKVLPIEIAEQIPILKSELQHCLINDGNTATFWRVWQKVLPILGKIFAEDQTAIDEQQLYRDIPLLLAELERSVHRDRVSADHYQLFVDALSNALMEAIQKKPVECIRFTELPYPEDHSDNSTRVTASILQQAQAINPGDWILYNSEDGQTHRCKLALKNHESDQLLFVDHSGRKVMVKTLKDFSLCLTTGVIRLLKPTSVNVVIANTIKQLIALGDKKAEQHQLEAEKLKQQEKDAKRAAAEKAKAEAHAIAEEKRLREASMTEAEREARRQQQALKLAEQEARVKAIPGLIDKLNVGAWIEITESESTTIRCKLSVIISSTQKFIFVTKVGLKAADYTRDQLVQDMTDGKIKIISNGDKFEDQLVKVIRGLRKDVS